MAFTRKSATLVNRVDGDLPTLPDDASEDMREWWSEFTEVFERVRSNTTDGNAFSDADKTKLSQTQIFTLDEKLQLAKLATDATSQTAQQVTTIATPAFPSQPSVVQQTLTKEEIEEILGITGEVVGTISDDSLILANAEVNGGFF